MTPIVIDIEVSGTSQGSYPIEVGLVLPDGTAHCYLISPARGWKKWDASLEPIHGITPEILETHGRPLEDVAWRLNELLRDKTIYSEEWSQAMSGLGKLFEAAHKHQDFTVSSIAELVSEEQMQHWPSLRDEVSRDLALKRKRASGDARVVQETYRRTQKKAA